MRVWSAERGWWAAVRLLVALVGACAAGPTASACRFTVRDIGFVDVRPPGWTLEAPFAFESIGVPDVGRDLRALTRGVNVAIDFAPGASGWRLIGPDGVVVGLDRPAGAAWDQLTRAVAAASSSPLRDRLPATLLGSFAVVMVVDGTDAEANAASAEAASEAVGLLRQRESALPRPIGSPPVIVHVPVSEAEAEGIVRAALGLPPTPAASAAVVMYGKGRFAGPVLRGDDVTAQALLRQLALVGQDCECNLDRSWVDQPSLPMRWPADLEASMVGSLGFNPASPLVRAEVAQILGQGGRRPGGVDLQETDPLADPAMDMLFGYSEVEVEAASARPIATPTPAGPDAGAPIVAAGSAAPEGGVVKPPAPATPKPTGSDGAGRPGRAISIGVILLGAAGAAVVLIAGVVVLIRGGRSV